MELLNRSVEQGTDIGPVVEIPDKATRFEVKMNRPANLPAPDQAPKESPIHFTVQVSLDKARTWFSWGGGNIKGGRWQTGRKLERRSVYQSMLPKGVNRLMRIQYEARCEFQPVFNVRFTNGRVP